MTASVNVEGTTDLFLLLIFFHFLPGRLTILFLLFLFYILFLGFFLLSVLLGLLFLVLLLLLVRQGNQSFEDPEAKVSLQHLVKELGKQRYLRKGKTAEV